MGYTTDFTGSLNLDKPASAKQVAYLNKFSGTRRMRRNNAKLQEIFKGEGGLDGNYGVDGEFFVGGLGMFGQDNDASVIEGNSPASTQPGLWCQWILDENGEQLQWDGGEKFYCYVEWLEYIIKNFFEHWGIKLNGEITWEGEDSDDLGKIIVVDNVVTTKQGTVTYN